MPSNALSNIGGRMPNNWTIVKAYIDSEESEELQTVEAYTDGSDWNGWANVALTRKGLTDWLNASPYDYRFFEQNENPAVRIYMPNKEEVIESSPLLVPTDGGLDLVEVYFMEGFCFLIMEEES